MYWACIVIEVHVCTRRYNYHLLWIILNLLLSPLFILPVCLISAEKGNLSPLSHSSSRGNKHLFLFYFSGYKNALGTESKWLSSLFIAPTLVQPVYVAFVLNYSNRIYFWCHIFYYKLETFSPSGQTSSVAEHIRQPLRKCYISMRLKFTAAERLTALAK